METQRTIDRRKFIREGALTLGGIALTGIGFSGAYQADRKNDSKASKKFPLINDGRMIYPEVASLPLKQQLQMLEKYREHREDIAEESGESEIMKLGFIVQVTGEVLLVRGVIELYLASR